MPRRHALIDREPWYSEGVHKMTVGNFIVYYVIDEESKTVWVVAVIYGRRDRLSILRDIM